MTVEWDKCICHGYSENPDNEVQLTDTSWIKLCESAKNRRDHSYYKLRAYIDGTLQLPLAITDIVRHVNCYKMYTLPKSILLMERKGTLEDASEPKGQHSHEKRSKIFANPLKATLYNLQSATNKLMDAAIIRGDKCIICQLAGGACGGTDAIAGDILKHNLCYSNYTCPSNLEKTAKHGTTNAEVHQDAFHDIVRMIQLYVVDEQPYGT